jgi:hypothetical protein
VSAVELEFEEATHTYRYRGRIVPSVTEILRPLSDFSGADPVKLEAGRRRGTAVHRVIELDNRGELDEESVDGEYLPRLNQWRLFIRESGFVVTACEQRVHHRSFGYAGTVDVVGEWQGTSWVVDIKTGRIPKSAGPQLAAYQMALEPKPRRRLCVQVSDHRYELQECKSLSDFALFQSCLNIWRFKNAA